MENFVIIIPARENSTRLPNKMLAEIGDKPMICHVAERAKEANIGDVFIGTDSKKISNVCENHGFNSIMTSSHHQSGTDRIYETLEKIDPQKNYKFIINLQGDVPFINPRLITELAEKIEHSNADILTLACKLPSPEKAQDSNIVNIAMSFYDKDKKFGRALYFSRQAIPHNASQFYEHIGIYLYRRAALEKFVKLTDSHLETTEKLEQLRALEHNMEIDVYVVDENPINVDTSVGLDRAREFYKNIPVQS